MKPGLTGACKALLVAAAVLGAQSEARSQSDEDCKERMHAFVDRRTGAAFNPCRERTTGGIGPRMLGGTYAPNFASVVAIRYRDREFVPRICTGVIVGPVDVLTAGHCGCGLTGTYVVSQEPRIGPEPPRASKLVHFVEQAPILFDRAVCKGRSLRGVDLALLKVSTKMQEKPDPKKEESDPKKKGSQEHEYASSVIAPVIEDFSGAELARIIRAERGTGNRVSAFSVLGYGVTETQSIGTRMRAEVPVLSLACAERRHWPYCHPFREMILADRTGRQVPRDSCKGDSGGPVFKILRYKLPNKATDEGGTVEIPILVGITSRSAPGTHVDTQNHCGGGGVYTSIGRQDVHDWLRRNGVPVLSMRQEKEPIELKLRNFLAADKETEARPSREAKALLDDETLFNMDFQTARRTGRITPLQAP